MFQMLSHNFLQLFTAISSFWQCQVPELDRPEYVMSFDICQVKYIYLTLYIIRYNTPAKSNNFIQLYI